jgi:hypothetical protein
MPTKASKTPRGPQLNTWITKATTACKRYMEADSSRTEALKDLARAVVKIRQATKDTDGKPDWAGRSQSYRDAIGKVYQEAGVPEDSQANIQAALRYHIGNVLRDEAPPADLKALGLKAEGPRERAATRKAPPAPADTNGHVVIPPDAAPTSIAEAVVRSIGEPVALVEQAVVTVRHAHMLPIPEDSARLHSALLELNQEVTSYLMAVQARHLLAA